jgi:UDP:flavonoid glycosyltransferase YjiC (YdhE family)
LVTAPTCRKASVLRQSFGLAPLPIGVNQFTGTLPLYLVPNGPEFDNYRRDLPPSVRYIGPCLWDHHQDHRPPAWIRDIPSGRPCVVVDEGALYTHEPRVLRMAARGLGGLAVDGRAAGRGGLRPGAPAPRTNCAERHAAGARAAN